MEEVIADVWLRFVRDLTTGRPFALRVGDHHRRREEQQHPHWRGYVRGRLRDLGLQEIGQARVSLGLSRFWSRRSPPRHVSTVTPEP